MTNLENYQLLHPDLLTEDTLLEILNDRCIEVPRLKSMNKVELVEIFKRIALPLPQRSYDNDTYLSRRLIRWHKRQGNIFQTSLGTEASSKNNSIYPDHDILPPENKRLSITSTGTELKEIRMRKSSTISNLPCNVVKRKSETVPREPPDCKKRQKITWP